jgi:CPA2 family monovalent cation:H+ antiporter-2
LRCDPILTLLSLIAAVGWVQWRSFVKIYAKAQFNLEEALSATPAPADRETESSASFAILKSAQLENVALERSSPVVGKLIREIGLRTRTGASIIGIERNGASIVNPGPDEELQAGDSVFLLGNRQQLDAARALLTRPEAAEQNPDSQ